MEHTQCERPLGKVFSELAKAYIGNFAERLSHLGINRYYYALVVIDKYKGNLSQTTLAEELFIDKAAVVRMLDYLEAQGCIVRKQNPKDRRAHMLELTPKALTMIPEITKAMRDTNALCADRESSGGLEKFYQQLQRIQESLKSDFPDRYDIHFNEKEKHND